MTASASPGLSAACEQGTLMLTLDRAPRNLLEPGLMDALRQALLDADADAKVSAIIIQGAGENFCAGLDVALMRQSADGPLRFSRALVALFKVFPRLGTPVIAAVRGEALAGGYSLVCAVDVAVAAVGARLGTYEASLGIWPMLAQVPPLHRLQSRHALENILTGDPFSAERALEVGIVNEVVAPERLDGAVRDWATRITRAGVNLAAGRRAFYTLLDLPYEQALDDAFGRFAEQFHTTEGS